MAKSAPDTKLEDVLSSVRRLVSDELPRNERPKLPEGPGALVLTDAQRIESNAAVRIAGRSLEERIAELEAAVGETANDDEFEPDGSEDQAEHRPDRIVYTRPPEPEEADTMRRNTLRLSQIALIDTGPANEDPDAASEDVQLQFRRETAKIAEADDADTDADEAPMAEDVKETLTAAEVHIFTSPDDEIARIEARLNGEPEPEVVAKSEKAPEIKVEAPIVLPLENIRPAAEPRDETPDMRSVAAEAESAADFDEELRAAVSSVDDLQDDTPEAAQSDDTEASQETGAKVEDAIAEAAIGATMAEVLDEEALRPVVAKLIRQELQGELGERITRNVRKLVRREILRALAARDAE